VCVFVCRGNVFTEPLPSKHKGYTYRHILMGGTYEVRHWDGLRCHGIHTKFYRDWFLHSIVYRKELTDTQTAQHGDLIRKVDYNFHFILLSLYWKMNIGLCDLHAVRASVNPLPINFWIKHNRPLWVAVQGLTRPTPYTYNFWIPERIFMKLHMYIMALEPFHKCVPSVCVSHLHC
jgi:hypothetical protein